MVHYDICQNSHHNEPLSCMGAKASQPTHFLKFRLTGFRLNRVDCNYIKDNPQLVVNGFVKAGIPPVIDLFYEEECDEQIEQESDDEEDSGDREDSDNEEISGEEDITLDNSDEDKVITLDNGDEPEVIELDTDDILIDDDV